MISFLHSCLHLEMKLSAFSFTSGLGKDTELGPNEPSPLIVTDVKSTGSRSGEPGTGSSVLSRLMESPRSSNFTAGIFNGGEGGEIGINGDCELLGRKSSRSLGLLVFVGRGGLNVPTGRRLRASGFGCDGGDGN